MRVIRACINCFCDVNSIQFYKKNRNELKENNCFEKLNDLETKSDTNLTYNLMSPD